mmetsp:Transcript_23082/g.35742  ORF Transcript_23082/g.35742 Transcript_23082/m.35742 type:complete len:89 (-) Transcript_23082:17-283(-)
MEAMKNLGLHDHKNMLKRQESIMMFEAFSKDGYLDPLDWLVLGQFFGTMGEEEAAFQGFYMAHLAEPEKIMTNSEMAFSTLGEEFEQK